MLQEKVGVLLLNLGTPDSTGYWDMRRYLKEFLSDRRVIEVNPILWKILLNVVILRLPPLLEYEWRCQCHELLELEQEKAESPLNLATPTPIARSAR